MFTPLVSPAVTPHDAQFRYSDYSVPGEYFSPLTSPALEAQNQASQRSVYGSVRGSDTSDTTSPIDPNIDPSLSLPTSAPIPPRKSRRKSSNVGPRNTSRAAHESLVTKPSTRKKQASSTTIPQSKVSSMIEEAEKSKRIGNAASHAKGVLPPSRSQESSEAESISPEPLTDVLMPPPATPKSATASKSPHIVANKPGSQSAPMPAIDNKPATPASLMRIRKEASMAAGSALKEQTSLLESELEQTMEDIVLPEPAKSTKRPALTPLRTGEAGEDEVTPTMSARKTPKFGPTSAPVTATASVFPSPQLNPSGSPNASQVHKRSDSRVGGRGGKKRTSSSSVQVSPALRPRISPSIKPLLPEGGTYNPVLFL